MVDWLYFHGTWTEDGSQPRIYPIIDPYGFLLTFVNIESWDGCFFHIFFNLSEILMKKSSGWYLQVSKIGCLSKTKNLDEALLKVLFDIGRGLSELKKKDCWSLAEVCTLLNAIQLLKQVLFSVTFCIFRTVVPL